MSTPPSSGATPARPGRAGPSRSALMLILLALIIVLALLLVLTRCGGGSTSHSTANPSPSRSTSPAVATTTVTATTTPSTPASTAPPPSSSAPAPSPVVTGSTNLTANGVALLPLSTSAGAGGDLSRYAGQPVTARSVQVISVPALNGFWVGTSPMDEIWVQLLQSGQVSPHAVLVGDHVSFTGVMAANPPGFAASAGVSAADGAALLTAEKAHIETNKSDLTFS